MKIPVISRIREWHKYERLHHYPALRQFDRAEALKRLKAYDREEREASKQWSRLQFTLLVVWMLLFFTLKNSGYFIGDLFILVVIPGWVIRYWMHTRIRRRVEAKVAAELRDGRLWTCVECGYDLRASPGPLCPECGSRITVGPEQEEVGEAKRLTAGSPPIDSGNPSARADAGTPTH